MWSRWQSFNLRPLPPEGSALRQLSYISLVAVGGFEPPPLRLMRPLPYQLGDTAVVPDERIELPTNGLQNRCSTTELSRRRMHHSDCT